MFVWNPSPEILSGFTCRLCSIDIDTFTINLNTITWNEKKNVIYINSIVRCSYRRVTYGVCTCRIDSFSIILYLVYTLQKVYSSKTCRTHFSLRNNFFKSELFVNIYVNNNMKSIIFFRYLFFFCFTSSRNAPNIYVFHMPLRWIPLKFQLLWFASNKIGNENLIVNASR